MNNETIILINEEELSSGYFTFGTSLTTDFNRIVNLVGGKKNFIELVERRAGNKITWRSCKVPAAYLGKLIGWSVTP